MFPHLRYSINLPNYIKTYLQLFQHLIHSLLDTSRIKAIHYKINGKFNSLNVVGNILTTHWQRCVAVQVNNWVYTEIGVSSFRSDFCELPSPGGITANLLYKLTKYTMLAVKYLQDNKLGNICSSVVIKSSFLILL